MGASADTLDAARSGDESAFRDLVAPHRSGLLAHCYRMSGSLSDAEDVVQEALLRAWRGLSDFRAQSSFRTWIYRIATHATLDALRQAKSRSLPVALVPAADPGSPPSPPNLEMHWLEPFPNALLPTGAPEADAVLSQRQAVALAFLQALQKLPATQRAAVLLKDVVGLSAAEIADLLETSVPATNSLVQRARDTLGKAPPPVDEDDSASRDLVGRYIEAWESSDVDALVTLLRDDARLSMPPTESWYDGSEEIATFLRAFVLVAGSAGRFQLAPTAANGMPAVNVFEGDDLIGVQLLDARAGRFAEIISFMDPAVLRFFAR